MITDRKLTVLPVYFVGVDLAWGDRNPTGWPPSMTAACCVTSGRPGPDDDVLAQLEPFTRGPCVVAFDAPRW